MGLFSLKYKVLGIVPTSGCFEDICLSMANKLTAKQLCRSGRIESESLLFGQKLKLQ